MADFRKAFADIAVYLQEKELVETSSPAGLRQSDTFLDADSERDHQYFSIMSFHDRGQADAAVQYIALKGMSANSTHHITYSMVDDPAFICGQDS